MTFDRWWNNLPARLPHGSKEQMRMAWEAALEAAACAVEERWHTEQNKTMQNQLSHGCIAAETVIRSLKFPVQSPR